MPVSVDLRSRTLHIRRPAVQIPITTSLLRDVLRGGGFRLATLLRTFPRNYFRQSRPRVAFFPHLPAPWYVLRLICWENGFRIVPDEKDADLLVHFEDTAVATSPAENGINARCVDIRKSHVERIWEAVSGIELGIDPRTHTGEAVMKSDDNGRHDGQIVQCPLAESELTHGMTYQRVVDNRIDNTHVQDLRCVVMSDKIALVYEKIRPLTKRFANSNTRVTLRQPDDCLSPAEQEQVLRCAQRLGLDCGEMDILRDKTSREIFVVDVNKTCLGPPVDLPMRDKRTALRTLAAAFERAFVVRT